MSIKVIDKLRKELDDALAAKEMDKDEVLKLSIVLDKYIVEYMRGNMPNRDIIENDKNGDL